MSPTASDALSPFPSEDAAEADADRAIAGPSHQTARHLRALSVHGPGTVSPLDSTALDDLRAQLRQTEIALERLKGDATACDGNLQQLREAGTQLAEEYARLSTAVRQTEQRGELAAGAVTALQQRLGPLELIRELTSSTDDKLASLGRVAEEIEHRAAAFQAQKTLIDHGLLEATRVVGLLSAVEARIATLTEHAHVLARAEETVGQLERRAAEATARLERRVEDFDTQKRGIEQALDNAARVSDLLAALDARVATQKIPRRSESSPPAVRSSSRGQKTGRLAGRWVAVFGVVAAAVGIGMTLDQPAQPPGPARMLEQGSGADASTLPSTPLSIPIATLPAHRPAAAIAGMPATGAGSDAPQAGPLRSPVVLAAAGGRSGSAATTRATETPGRSPETRSAQNTAQFIGALVVESVPSGAVVFINQKDAGRTPLQVRRLRAGSHVIRVEHEGYERWTTTALVPADRETRVSAKLQPGP